MCAHETSWSLLCVSCCGPSGVMVMGELVLLITLSSPPKCLHTHIPKTLFHAHHSPAHNVMSQVELSPFAESGTLASIVNPGHYDKFT
jgi:hypothetical protein